MPGNIADRMAHWDDVQRLIKGYPVRRVWEIFNKMLVDREKFILGNQFGYGGYGFLMRGNWSMGLRYSNFVNVLVSYMDLYGCALYPPYPDESGIPLLNSFSNILQYGSRKYPEWHKPGYVDFRAFPHLTEYKPEDFYKTAAAGGDNEYAFINQYQLFEKLWNLLHYFGGTCISQRDSDLVYWQTRGDSDYPGQSYSYGSYTNTKSSSGNFNGLRFFYTPEDDLEYKYIGIGVSYGEGDRSASGILQHAGRNILYESNWVQGAFTSPWLQEDSSYHEYFSFGVHLFIFPHFPDFYDPDTLEPIYF